METYINKTHKLSLSVDYYTRAYEIRRNLLPPDHLLIATSLSNFGSSYDHNNDFTAAVEAYMKTLNNREQNSPNQDDLYKAQAMGNIGLVHRVAKNYELSLDYLTAAHNMYTRMLPEEHPFIALSLWRLGGLYYLRHKYEKALDYYCKAIEIEFITLPDDHPDLNAHFKWLLEVFGLHGADSLHALLLYEKYIWPRKEFVKMHVTDLFEKMEEKTSRNKQDEVHDNLLYLAWAVRQLQEPNLGLSREEMEIRMACCTSGHLGSMLANMRRNHMKSDESDLDDVGSVTLDPDFDVELNKNESDLGDVGAVTLDPDFDVELNKNESDLGDVGAVTLDPDFDVELNDDYEVFFLLLDYALYCCTRNCLQLTVG